MLDEEGNGNNGKKKGGAEIPAWVVTFADLMSLLLAFFVLLFSFSELDSAKYKQVGGSMKEAFGVQQEIKIRDPLKGLQLIASDFSPGRPDPSAINEIRQETTNVYKRYMASHESSLGGGEEVMDSRGERDYEGQIGRMLEKLDTAGYGHGGTAVRQAASALKARLQDTRDAEERAADRLRELAAQAAAIEGGRAEFPPGGVLKRLAKGIAKGEAKIAKQTKEVRNLFDSFRGEFEAELSGHGDKEEQKGSGLGPMMQASQEELEEKTAEKELLMKLAKEMEAQEEASGISMQPSALLESMADEVEQEADEQSRISVGLRRLEREFEKEIEQGTVEIVGGAEDPRVNIRVSDSATFAPGSAEVTGEFNSIIDRISKLLKGLRGTVIVSGHTDNIPISTGRFRSNWDLSSARAATVVHALIKKSTLPQDRFRVEGYADTNPLESNKTPAGRSKNRRVEISLLRRDLARSLLSSMADTRVRTLNLTENIQRAIDSNAVTVEDVPLPGAPAKSGGRRWFEPFRIF